MSRCNICGYVLNSAGICTNGFCMSKVEPTLPILSSDASFYQMGGTIYGDEFFQKCRDKRLEDWKKLAKDMYEYLSKSEERGFYAPHTELLERYEELEKRGDV